MTFPMVVRSFLPPNTIKPVDESLFDDYFNRIYEDIAFAVNERDFVSFPMEITDVAQPIVNLPNFGAYIICVSGIESGLPSITASLCKSDAGVAGSITVLGSQAGTVAPFAAATLTITTSATNFLINHSVANTSGNFSIRIIGTQ